MKSIKKQIRQIAYVLSLLILFQGCTVYKSASITLDQASKVEQKVKVITKGNEKLKFNRIGIEDGSYYGVKKQKGEIIRTLLDPKRVNEVNVKDRTMSTILTICLPIAIIVGVALIIGDQSYSFNFSESDFQW